ncbi:hypothetical protein EVAR_26035_1 [Eumeta japonica]|uniref:Uncharacterized protein n=1 Tax=Eumeta variegata TaxID=151549 RepID=A0A4C1VT14_EUMVA|nr:hypothetical protein EVAR_26035_1 [Eumeta japonica]
MEPENIDGKKIVKPKTMLELLPELTGILTKESIITLTAKKHPRNITALSSNTEKNLRPMTIAEMMPQLQVLKMPTPKISAQPPTSKRRPWNSSVKTDGKRADAKITKQKLKNSSVRKVLNFQPKPKPIAPIDRTLLNDNFATPKFKKPNFKTQLELRQCNNLRISGINSIAPTPVNDHRKYEKSDNNVAVHNKENAILSNCNKAFLKPPNKKMILTTGSYLKVHETLDTPVPNSSINSNNDTFLQKEKEINELEERISTMTCDDKTLENIDEVSPPASTPFTDYRSVQECFNDSSDFENSAIYNNTIMCFDKTFYQTDNNEKEDSMIVSLCDLLDKACVENPDPTCHELENLLALEKQIQTSLQMLTTLKENNEKALSKVKELIQIKRNNLPGNINMSLVTSLTQKVLNEKGKVMISKNIHKRSVAISKTPIKNIADKKQSLRKTALHKSMPSGLNDYSVTKIQLNDRSPATCMYQELKQSMNFLHTPMKERASQAVPDTPAITSHNIQKQLSKLYEN